MFPKPLLLVASVVLFNLIDFVESQNPLMNFTSLTKENISWSSIPSKNINRLTDTSSPGKIFYIIINAKGNTYGYDIYINTKRYIHQLTIPGIAGNNGFSNKTEAEKTAKLVIKKIKRGEMPPTVSRDELQHLHITQ